MPADPHPSFVDRFMARIMHSYSNVLFEELPDVQFFMKDTRGRYVQVNHVLKENYMMADDRDIISKTDYQLFPQYLADNYVQDDQQVFQGVTIRNRIELVGRYDGTAIWSSTTKTPIRSRHGNVIGLAGISREIGKMSSMVLPYQELASVTRHIEANYSQAITVVEMAKIAAISPRSLQRKFHVAFRMSPLQYLRRVRISEASRLLATTGTPISTIAADTGFADQSHLTRAFVDAVGKTPGAFRKRYHHTAGD
ncbi:MAG: AraC family transcriptional regulator [Planctomycetes bacterium]|nr:AraC family transcriptional regulator [Planctomycetota bacterium]